MEKSRHQMLAAAVARLLKPLIRILLRNGVSYGTFADIAKGQFVEVASKEFGIEGRKQSISRVAVITGLTRKEVLRLTRAKQPDDRESADQYNRAARVIGGWRRDEAFLDPRGKPAVLTIAGVGNTFQELVRRYSGDVPYRAILDELVTEGSAERLDGDRVRMIDRAYVPRADESMKLHILGTDTAFLIDTINHNLTPENGSPRFQRKVLYDNLPDETLPELRRLSVKASQSLLEKLDKWLSDHDRDTQPGIQGTGRNTAGVGIYYFEKSGEEER
jgi:Family of unknown function (DUF6502)